jgi:parvulin-like peptidyl-prolyl isomerase
VRSTFAPDSLLVLTLTIAIAAGIGASCKTDEGRSGARPVVEMIPVGARATKDPRSVITEAEYRAELAKARLVRDNSLNATPLPQELKEAILGAMIDRRLLAMEAAKKVIRASTVAIAREMAATRASLPDYDKQLIQTYQTEADLKSSIEERLVATQLLKQEAFSQVKVTEDDVRQLWSSLPESEKIHPARVHAAQIVLRTEEEGRAAIGALKKGEDFGDLAKRKSISPEKERGGDLGWFESGVMPTVFDEVCFALNPGQVSELTASEYGFHIFKVIEAEPEHALTFEEARPQLFERLREERIRTAESNYMEALRARVRIVRHDQLISAVE